MLEKFHKITNVGKFVNYQAEGKVDLRKVNLIYGENGRGKTTLAVILRSLTSKNANFIYERKTVGSSEVKASIQIRVKGAGKPICFRDGDGWDAHVPGIEIFDSNFINDNVYSGSDVSHEHRKNLYYFVVGEEGVNLAQQLDELDEKFKKLKGEISEKSLSIERLVEWKGDIDKFVDLPLIDNLDTQIKEVKEQIAILEQADIIKKRNILQQINLNAFPIDEIESLLVRKVEDLLASAESQVRTHIENCLDSDGELWLQKGLTYTKDEKCPFCGQLVHGVDLIKFYQAYYSQEYSKLKKDILSLEVQIREYFSEDILLGYQKTIDANLSLFDAWGKSGLELAISTMSSVRLIDLWKHAREGWQVLISEKNEHPLDDIDANKLSIARNAFELFFTTITTYNKWVTECNLKTDEFKKTVDAGNLDATNKTLKMFEATKKRYTKSVDALCKEYKTLIQDRNKADADKKTTKKSLDTFVKDVFDKYQATINEYLKKFGVGFRLDKISTSFAGGKASTSYGLLLNNVPVKLSAGATAEPSFKSGASEGDKSSLAFAFFLAKLEHDKDIANKIVVLDDPITSLDAHRKSCTKDEVIKIVKKALQVIVLSHDLTFLRMVWDGTPGPVAEIQTLLIQREGKDQSKLSEWDIAEATRGDYYSDFYAILNYAEKNEGDARLVVRSIRPLLEGYYRVRFPKDFPANKWLGDLAEFIRNADDKNSLYVLRNDLSEIMAINNYSKKYHHKENPNADNEPINDSEIVSFIERTLKLISG